MLDFIKAVFLFGLVLVLAWLSTRLVGYRMGAAMRGRMVRVLEQVPVGRDRSVVVLEVGGRLYLVGATAQQVTLIDAIDDPDTISRLLAQAQQPDTPLAAALGGSFREVLDRIRGGGKSAPGSQEPSSAAPLGTPDAERLQEQLDRLRRMQEK